MQRIRITIGILFVISVCIADCAAVRVVGRWREEALAVDGNDREWQGAPQYYDDDRQLVIRVSNDAQAVYLCVSTSDRELQHQLRMTGMTVWLDPGGAKEQVFGIHLPGGDDRNPHRAPRSEGGSLPPPQWADQARPHEGLTTENGQAGQPPVPSPVEALTEVSITYADTTGPLTMNIEEVRRTGIDIGTGRPDGKRLVYEFRIDFRSAPSLAGLGPGMVLGVGIQTGSEGDNPGGVSPGGKMSLSYGPGGSTNGGPGPGGGKGGGPEGARPGKNGDTFDIWLQVQLACQASG